MRLNTDSKWLKGLILICISVTVLVVQGCGDEPSEDSDGIFVGGQIINPSTDFIVFSKNGSTLDTIRLDERNRFSIFIQNPEQGLYLIKHGPETQNLYLKPGDSLLLRANTLAFDESLHFSGRGDDRNNFMAEMYLLDESNAELVLDYYKIPPVEFARKTDSIRQARLSTLEAASEESEFSDEFKELAGKVINYEFYDLRERYTYLVQKYYKKYLRELPEDFHNYRKSVNFNDPMMVDSPSYRRFIENYLINYSLEWCARSNTDTEDCYDLTSNRNILARIQRAAEILELPALRHFFLTKLGVFGIVMAKEQEEMQRILDLLEDKGFSEEQMTEMRQLAAIQVAYLPGTVLNEVPLVDYKGQEISIDKIINKPTIVFLWSMYSRSHQVDHRRIERLRKKYPEINFIGINLDVGEVEEWQKVVKTHTYPTDYEFQLGRTRIKKEFFQYYLNKLLFLNSEGKVIIGDAFINAPDFEERILEFLNR